MKISLVSLGLLLAIPGVHAAEPLLLYSYGNLAHTSELMVYDDGKVVVEERFRGVGRPEISRLSAEELAQLRDWIDQFSEITSIDTPYRGFPDELFGGLVIRQGRRMLLVRSHEMTRRVMNGTPIAILMQQWVNERTQLDLPLQ